MPLRHEAEGAGWQVSGPALLLKLRPLKALTSSLYTHVAKHAVGAVVLSDSDINHHCVCM